MSEEQIDVGAVEKEARSQGWVPKEEFRGPENAWVDAAEFVERGQKILPILQANNRRLMEEQRKEREKHQKELDELRQATEEFKKFQKEAYERKTRELDNEIAKIREQKKQAIADGDGDLVVELDDRLDDLKTQKREAKTVEMLLRRSKTINHKLILLSRIGWIIILIGLARTGELLL